jgi:hypothetical protein
LFDIFNPLNIEILLVDLALVYHLLRSGRSPVWLAALGLIGVTSFVMPGLSLLATFGLWIAYLFVAVIPDFWNSRGMRAFKGNVAKATDPGRDYREKKRQAELVSSVDAKRELAEESLKRGLYAEAVDLYLSAMQGPLGEADPVLLKGLGRARLFSGDGAEAERLFLKMREIDPAAFDANVELDYARALELQGRNDEALRQYQAVANRFPGEEARTRYALLLEKSGRDAEAQALFREVIDSVKGAPRHYRSRQGEWDRIARQHLKS